VIEEISIVAYVIQPGEDADWEYVLMDEQTQTIYRTCLSMDFAIPPDHDLLTRAATFLKGAARETVLSALAFAHVIGEAFR
jgi:hypothetical protein